MLRAAIAQKWSEDKLAERLTNKLQTWQADMFSRLSPLPSLSPTLWTPLLAKERGSGPLTLHRVVLLLRDSTTALLVVKGSRKGRVRAPPKLLLSFRLLPGLFVALSEALTCRIIRGLRGCFNDRLGDAAIEYRSFHDVPGLRFV
eukprot:s5149_g5.t1